MFVRFLVLADGGWGAGLVEPIKPPWLWAWMLGMYFCFVSSALAEVNSSPSALIIAHVNQHKPLPRLVKFH